MTTTHAAPVTPDQGAPEDAAMRRQWDDDLSHVVCECDELLSLCGVRLAGDVPWDPDADDICPLCLLGTCPTCGDMALSGGAA